MLRQRLMAAALGLPMLFLLLWLNWFLRSRGNPDDLPMLFIVLLIAGASGWEVSQVLRQRYPRAAPRAGIYAALIVPFIVHAVTQSSSQGIPSLGMCIDSLGAVAVTMGLFLSLYTDIELRKGQGIRENVIVLLSGLYLGGTLSCLIFIGRTPLHEIGLLFIFVLVFGLDTAAYFGGKHFHGPPLAPKISPKKTIAGSLCGLLAAILLAFAFKVIPAGVAAGDAASPIWWNLGAWVPSVGLLWLGVSVGIAGQVGDLIESAFKRWGGVKDSGATIPGHGGFLDRFDSLFLAAPVCYLLLMLYLKVAG